MADGRVLLSAASLTKPGNFDLSTMDSGLFLGLNLFAVLPGPLPGRETVDKLLIAGHTLAQRLRGELRDARGEPLTEARLTRDAPRGCRGQRLIWARAKKGAIRHNAPLNCDAASSITTIVIMCSTIRNFRMRSLIDYSSSCANSRRNIRSSLQPTLPRNE